jgi:plasmid stability protein
MTRMELTQVYLEPGQKKALQAKARAHGTKVAEEVRRAVDAYLAGISPDQLDLLDAATRTAERQLKEMVQELDLINERLDRAFAQLSPRRPTMRKGGR